MRLQWQYDELITRQRKDYFTNGHLHNTKKCDILHRVGANHYD